MAKIVKRFAWYLLFIGFIFGVTERFLATDLFSVAFAGGCLTIFLLLYPDL